MTTNPPILPGCSVLPPMEPPEIPAVNGQPAAGSVKRRTASPFLTGLSTSR